MTPKEFQKLCKTAALKGAYLFFGEEEYMKSRCLLLARKAVIGEEEDVFNHIKLNAKDPNFTEALSDAVISLPMFQSQKLVEVHSLDFTRLSSGDTEGLIQLLTDLKDYEETVLVFYAESEEFDAGRSQKAPSALYKKLDAVLHFVRFDYETRAGLVSWVMRHFQAYSVFCPPEIASELIDFCSKDMYTLASEVEKLAYYTLSLKEDHVKAEYIYKISEGKRIDGAFDFTDAILKGESDKACRLLHSMADQRERPETVLGGVIDTISGMYKVKILLEEGHSNKEISKELGIHEFRVEKFRNASAGKSVKRLERALALCLEGDLQIKRSLISNYTVLERLVMRLCRL